MQFGKVSNPIQSKQFYDKALTDIIRQNVYVTHFQDRLRENNLFVENISWNYLCKAFFISHAHYKAL